MNFVEIWKGFANVSGALLFLFGIFTIFNPEGTVEVLETLIHGEDQV